MIISTAHPTRKSPFRKTHNRKRLFPFAKWLFPQTEITISESGNEYFRQYFLNPLPINDLRAILGCYNIIIIE